MNATRHPQGAERRAPLLAALALAALATPAGIGAAAAQTAAPPATDPAPAPSPTPTPAPAATPAPTPEAAPRWSGLVYGDYYDVLRSHRDELEQRNGFWIRRLYFAYDLPLSTAFAMRLRVETNSKGDFQSTGVLSVYLKDAWIKWTHGAHAVAFGMVPTPSIEFVDGLQGYRPLEKSPIDLYKWDSSRDTGLLARGRLGAQRTEYALELGNGSGSGSETDAGKALRGQLLHRFARGLVLEGYADFQQRPAGRSRSTLEAMLVWQRRAWRASLQYGHQRRRGAGRDGADLGLDFLSAFAAAPLRPNLELVGRLDRAFQAVPGGETFDYFPFSEKARLVVGYAGLDFLLAKHVHLIPNVEFAAYDRAADGTRPGTDVMPRATVFFNW